jgi:hypothetical protein
MALMTKELRQKANLDRIGEIVKDLAGREVGTLLRDLSQRVEGMQRDSVPRAELMDMLLRKADTLSLERKADVAALQRLEHLVGAELDEKMRRVASEQQISFAARLTETTRDYVHRQDAQYVSMLKLFEQLGHSNPGHLVSDVATASGMASGSNTAIVSAGDGAEKGRASIADAEMRRQAALDADENAKQAVQEAIHKRQMRSGTTTKIGAAAEAGGGSTFSVEDWVHGIDLRYSERKKAPRPPSGGARRH